MSSQALFDKFLCQNFGHETAVDEGGSMNREIEPSRKPPEEAPRQIQSNDIFRGQRLVVIQHAGQEYRLTITRNDKLILQK